MNFNKEMPVLTKQFDVAVEKVSSLPDSRQDEIAQIMIWVAEQPRFDQRPRLTPDQMAEVEDAMANSPQVSEDEMNSVWLKHGIKL